MRRIIYMILAYILIGVMIGSASVIGDALSIKEAKKLPAVSIDAGNVRSKIGATVNIPIRLRKRGGDIPVVGFNVDMTFDSDTLKVLDVFMNPTNIADKIVAWNQIDDDTIRFIVYGLNKSIIPAGTVVYVHVQVLDTATPGETTSLILSNGAVTDPDANPLNFILKNGTFIIQKQRIYYNGTE